VRGGLLVALQLLGRQVEHRHPRAQYREGCRLLASATGQAKHFLSPDLAQLTVVVETMACVGFCKIEIGPREKGVGANQRAPTTAVVVCDSVHAALLASARLLHVATGTEVSR
jgi:hypothetical protein